MLTDMVLMRPTFFTKRQARRAEVEKKANWLESEYQEKADDLEAQYKRVFSVQDREAKINITGPLSPDGPDWVDVWLGYGGTAYKNISRAAAEAKELYDQGRIDKVIVKMNTPGGYLDQLDQAYQALKQISNIGEVRNEGIIASAGVWLASAFNRITPATDSAQIGSIGVVATILDYTGYLDNFGIKEVEITNTESPNKRPDVLTAEGVDVIRRELDDLYGVFVSKVTAARPITKATIDGLKGEMLIASKAIDAGLMDLPQAGDSQAAADTQNNNNEMEVSKLDITKTNETPQKETEPQAEVLTQDQFNKSLEAERARVYGLLKISGVKMSDDLKKAIEDGVEVGAFAIAQADRKEAKDKAEVEAAKKLREENHDQKVTLKPETLGTGNGDDPEDDEKGQKVDALVDANINPKKGGKK